MTTDNTNGIALAAITVLAASFIGAATMSSAPVNLKATADDDKIGDPNPAHHGDGGATSINTQQKPQESRVEEAIIPHEAGHALGLVK